MKLFELHANKTSFWPMLKLLGIDDEKKTTLSDFNVDWHNKNSIKAVESALKDPDLAVISKLMFYQRHILKESNFGAKVLSLEEFKKALSHPVKAWRGGAGTFNPDYKDRRKWTSFTADQNRVKTFSEYDGTMISAAYKLNKREHYWIVEVDLTLNDILLYFDAMDEELILPSSFTKKAKVIVQK